MIIKKIIKLLSHREQKIGFMLLLMTLVMAFLDMIGVASIMPFIAVLANPQIIETNLILSKLFIFFEFEKKDDFILFLGLAAFALLVFSLAFKSLTTYMQLRFALMHEYMLGKRLVEGYLYQPYKWFLNRNSAEISKSILSEVSAVVNGCLMPMMSLVTQGAVAIAIMGMILFVNPMASLIVCLVLGLSYGLIYKAVSNFLNKLGVKRAQANELRFKVISEAFGAFKEVKVGGLERFFIDHFSTPAKNYAEKEATASIVRQLPKYALEMVAFGGMLLALLYIIAQKGFTDAIPIIALYAFAGYRFMPALQQIYSSLTQLKFVGPVLDSIYEDLISLEKETENNKKEKIDFKDSIELKKVFFTYPNESQPVLKNINLSIKCKQKIGIVGGTGSGKTTTVDLILGLLKPERGSLTVDELEINSQNYRRWQSMIGYVPQQIYLSDESIAENIAFGVDKEDIDYKAVERVAKIANLHDLVNNELKNGYQSVVGERGIRLSGGQRQRIGIARALYHNPKLLIFDEATNSLDNLTEKAVIESIQNIDENITIIMIAHRLNTVRNCDTIFLIEGGNLVAQGSFDELLKNNSSFKKMVNSD